MIIVRVRFGFLLSTDREDEDFAHRAHRTMVFSARKTSRLTQRV